MKFEIKLKMLSTRAVAVLKFSLGLNGQPNYFRVGQNGKYKHFEFGGVKTYDFKSFWVGRKKSVIRIVCNQDG